MSSIQIRKRSIDLEELKIIQLDILSAVDEFCCNNDIHYSLACGTLLGAVRHGGYIPWDDDIDIYLLRSDYDRLIKEFPNIYHERYRFVTLERDAKWSRAYGKIYDANTVIKEATMETFELGVNIDVFPIDNVPQDKIKWQKYNKRRKILQNIYLVKVIKFRNERSLLKNLFLILCKIICFLFSSRFVAECIQKVAKRYNDSETSKVYETCQGLFQKHPFRKSLFDNLIVLPFEDRKFMAFADYDEYLTNAYGDWHQLPPKEKRISHHVFQAFWKE